jgi:hypothetical protein
MMKDLNLVREHMEVIAADGESVGTVDRLEGSLAIKLTKSGPAAGGKHHMIPTDWIDRVDSHVHLSKSAKDVRSQWKTAA